MNTQINLNFLEQPNLFANYNGRAFIENPFMRQSTPSVLIQGAYKLNAEEIEKSFIQTCFRLISFFFKYI